MHLWDVHYDFIPPPPYDRLFDPDYRGTITGVDFMENTAVHREMDPRDLEHLVALYDGEIRFTDEILGDDPRRPARRGLLDDTLVAVTADHGEEFFEHGRNGHQQTLYDEVVRVPLVLHWPGRLAGGRVVRDQVRLVDLMPTFLAAAGAAPPYELQGRDVLPLAQGRALPPRTAFLELHADGRDQRALRTLELKAYARGAPGGRKLADARYDLREDPRERIPLRRRDDPRVDRPSPSSTPRAAGGVALHRRLGGQARAADVDDETRGGSASSATSRGRRKNERRRAGRPAARSPAWLHVAVLAAAFAALFAWTWGRWPDVVIDFGRELYVPWRMLEGEQLFRDLSWFNGPLSPHWNALVFRRSGSASRRSCGSTRRSSRASSRCCTT